MTLTQMQEREAHHGQGTQMKVWSLGCDVLGLAVSCLQMKVSEEALQIYLQGGEQYQDADAGKLRHSNDAARFYSCCMCTPFRKVKASW